MFTPYLHKIKLTCESIYLPNILNFDTFISGPQGDYSWWNFPGWYLESLELSILTGSPFWSVWTDLSQHCPDKVFFNACPPLDLSYTNHWASGRCTLCPGKLSFEIWWVEGGCLHHMPSHFSLFLNERQWYEAFQHTYDPTIITTISTRASVINSWSLHTFVENISSIFACLKYGE